MAVTAPTAMFNLKNITGAVVVRGGILMTNKPRVTNLETRVTVIKLVQKEGRAAATMGVRSGQNGLVVGLANKRALAWSIAKAADEAGARLTLSYATERFEANTRKLSDTLSAPAQLVACDVSDDQAIAGLCRSVDDEFGGLDFVVHGPAFASRESLSNPFVQTTRSDFSQALDISAYSLTSLAFGAMPLMPIMPASGYADFEG